MGICGQIFKISNTPNLLTLMRIFMAGWIFKIGIFREDDPFALLLWATGAGISDMLDGWLAKKMHWETEFGAAFDPVADKLFIASLLFVFYTLGYWPASNTSAAVKVLKGFAICLAATEITLIIFYVVGFIKGKKLSASKWGKWKMRFFCAAAYLWIVYFVIEKSNDGQIPVIIILAADTLLVLTIVCAGFSLDDYWERYK